MDFDLPSNLGDLEYPVVRDLLGALQFGRDVLLHGPAGLAPHIFPLLCRPSRLLFVDLHLVLVDDICIGGYFSADDGFPEAVAGLDDDVVGTAVGVHCEHNSGYLGVDHLLDDDGQFNFLAGISALLAV